MKVTNESFLPRMITNVRYIYVNITVDQPVTTKCILSSLTKQSYHSCHYEIVNKCIVFANISVKFLYVSLNLLWDIITGVVKHKMKFVYIFLFCLLNMGIKFTGKFTNICREIYIGKL